MLIPKLTQRQSFKIYAYGTSAWLALEALPLLFTPKLIVTMAASEPRLITDLETYLCRTLGLAFLTFSLLVLLLTGALPLTTDATRNGDINGSGTTSPTDPNAYPTLVVTTVYHALTAFYLYAQLTYQWNFAFGAGIVGSTGLFCLGVWTIMFGGSKGRVSKTTGADKRTSSYPFKSEESAKEKKRESKRKSVLRSKSYGRE